MPKMKTNKSVASRVRVTKNGKILRRRTGCRHLMTGKSGNKKRKMRKPTPVIASNWKKKIKIALTPAS
jgi:large subunit ribosomal protein L35